MGDIISLAARRMARPGQDGQKAREANQDVGGEAAPCSVLLFTGIHYQRGDVPPGGCGRPWYTRLDARDAAEPGTP